MVLQESPGIPARTLSETPTVLVCTLLPRFFLNVMDWEEVLKSSDDGIGKDRGFQGVARQWTFLNNHAHVLLCLARDPDMLLREVARLVGITERATQKIVKDLVESRVLLRYKEGRCNRYRINLDHPLRHPLESSRTVGELLTMLLTEEELTRARSPDGKD